MNNDYTNSILSKFQTKFTIPEIKPIKPLALSLAEANYASEFYERLKEYIIEFEKTLSEYEEVAIKLVSFGESIIVHVEDLGYYNPSVIVFSGTTTTGARVQLIQNVSQLSFLLMAVKIEEPLKERERIGYKLQHEKDKTSQSDEDTNN